MDCSFNKNREFAESYNDYYPVVFSSLYTKIGNAEDARDLCQNLFVKFYEKLDEIENRRKWLYGAIRLELLSFYRKKRRDNIDIDNLFNDVRLTFVNGFRDVRIIINEAIENIDNFSNERERTLFDLIAIHNFTYEETASQLGLSKRQVRYRYSLIVNRIQDYLSKKGIKSMEDLL